MQRAVAQEVPEKLSLAISAPALIYGPVWVALAEKLFDQQGVSVNVVSTNAFSTGSAMLVSGQTDLVANTAFVGLRIATEGKQLTYIMSVSNMGAPVNAMIGRPSIHSVEELAAMGKNCRVMSLPSGSATWALYHGIAARYNLQCTISTASTIPLVVAGALSGQFDAAIVNPQDAYAARESGKASILLDPLTMDDATAEAIYPYHHPVAAVFGLRPNLEAKRNAVTRFVRALRIADQHIERMSDEQLGELMKRLPEVFGSTPTSALVLQWRIQAKLGPRGAEAGRISAAEWDSFLSAASASWGFANLDPNNPGVRYSNIIDMSYFDAAK